MPFLISGRSMLLIAMVLSSMVILIYMRLAEKGRRFELRRVPGLDAIAEAVGRCTELKRPLHYNVGLGALRGDSAAPTLAGISVLSYVSELCAKYQTEMIVTCSNYEQLPFLQESVRTAFVKEGKRVPEEYVRFVGQGQYILSAACQGIFERENIGANLMIGFYDEECILIVEKGFRVGAMGIGGSSALGQAAIMAAAMDYILIGEELYAAGAYVSGDPSRIGSISGADMPKIAAAILIILGLVLVQFGVPFVKWLRL